MAHRENTTFRQDLETEALPERITHAVIGEFGWGGHRQPSDWPITSEVIERPMPWSQAAPLLDYPYDDSFGAPECNAVYAYTPTRVLFVVQYDGKTMINWVPRSPSFGPVEMPGG